MFAFFNLDRVIAPLVPYRQLEQVRCLPRPNWRITNPTSFEIMQQFSDKKRFFAMVKTGCFDFFIDCWLRPKLKFYLFPLTRPTLKKGPTQKNLF